MVMEYNRDIRKIVIVIYYLGHSVNNISAAIYNASPTTSKLPFITIELNYLIMETRLIIFASINH